ncbi:MAG: flagellar hook-associated protein FlgK [Silicimonas sp.]|nr:flagellar hook-associated protein FlgK [Silicimonas sp.]
MSISGALSNALTGLTAASRSAQVVSNNVSNALTDGYARREIELSSRHVGGSGAGVQIDGVRRVVDETLLREKRLASAAVGSADAAAGFHKSVFDLVGSPEDPFSLTYQVTEFESAVLEASSRPEAEARLSNVLSSAQSLTRKLNEISDGIQVLRQDADVQIESEVRRLNDSLVRIADLNEQILRAKGVGIEYPGLLDQRQVLIDDISDLVPVRQIPRENGSIALYTMNGALLLDIEPAEFGFEASAPITADMTIGSGALSGLTLNGAPVPLTGVAASVAGGSLAGLFEVRDDLAVAVQDNLDEVARDLVARFEDPGLDPTLSLGDPGFFTDRGSALNPLDTVGLASRIQVNDLVDPAEGGELWRIRDGLAAIAPGPVGDASLLSNMIQVLEDKRVPIGGSFSGASRSVADYASTLISLVGQSLQDGNTRLSFETARFQGMEEAALADRVDTDQELQKLLLVEQAYAANARVIQTVDELMQLLIGL